MVVDVAVGCVIITVVNTHVTQMPPMRVKRKLNIGVQLQVVEVAILNYCYNTI